MRSHTTTTGLSNERTRAARLREVCALTQQVVDLTVAPLAREIDRDCRWPRESMRALSDSGLNGLLVPERLGGFGEGLEALASVTELLGIACASTAMCYGMHCVGAAVIAAKATPEQENRYLRPIVDSGHVTTLALSEKGTGVHFYLPQTSVEREADAFVVQGVKQFVTNGGHADSYVVSVRAPATRTHPGEFSCLMIDRDADGVSWRDPWRGFGMRGTASTAMAIDRARVPLDRLLGEEGDQIWFVFEVVAPYFLVAMSGTYLGVAQAALNQVLAHLRTRRYQHSGETLAEVSVVQHRLARIWTEVERTRLLIREAARLGDRGEPSAMTSLIAAKAAAGDTAVLVANEAMTLCGGTAYRENGALAQALRDARAGHVMSPTTDLLREWLAKSLLGMPLL